MKIVLKPLIVVIASLFLYTAYLISTYELDNEESARDSVVSLLSGEDVRIELHKVYLLRHVAAELVRQTRPKDEVRPVLVIRTEYPPTAK